MNGWHFCWCVECRHCSRRLRHRWIAFHFFVRRAKAMHTMLSCDGRAKNCASICRNRNVRSKFVFEQCRFGRCIARVAFNYNSIIINVDISLLHCCARAQARRVAAELTAGATTWIATNMLRKLTTNWKRGVYVWKERKCGKFGRLKIHGSELAPFRCVTICVVYVRFGSISHLIRNFQYFHGTERFSLNSLSLSSAAKLPNWIADPNTSNRICCRRCYRLRKLHLLQPHRRVPKINSCICLLGFVIVPQTRCIAYSRQPTSEHYSIKFYCMFAQCGREYLLRSNWINYAENLCLFCI